MEKKKMFLLFADGEKVEITGETDKFWICGETQYRKSNLRIVKTVKETVKQEKEKDKKQEPEKGDE